MPTYDLLAEPWIPVVYLDGRREEIGLRRLLHEAHQLREVSDPLPTIEFGLYRLLTALVMDIFHPRHVNALAALLDAGRFQPGHVDPYLDCWAGHFDLFHAEHPFLQTPGLENEEEKPLAGLLHCVPSGTNVLHFHHAHEEAFAVCPAAGARLLATIAPFMTAGGAGLSPSINGAPPWYVLVLGRTLFETLCLNACVVPLSPEPRGSAPPAWRRTGPAAGARATQASLLEGFTWQPRRIRLVPGGPGRCSLLGSDTPTLIRGMRFKDGASCDFSWCDPSVPYRLTPKGRFSLRPQEGRELWRDTGPLTLLREADYKIGKDQIRFERPALVTQYALLLDEGLIEPRPLELRAYGIRTDGKMKYFEWQRETLCLPAGLIRSGAHAGDAQAAMERADSVAYALRLAVKHVYPRDGAGNEKAFEARIAAAQRHFWADLHPHYDTLLEALAALPTGDAREQPLQASLQQWHEALSQVGTATLDDAIGDLDTNALMLQRQVEARRRFRSALWALSHPEEVADRKAARKAAAKTSKGGS